MIIIYIILLILLLINYYCIQKKTIENITQNNNLNHKFIIFIPYCTFFKKYIKKCLNSIYKQNYSNYEIIIVNDGDNSNKINNLTKTNKKTKIIRHSERLGPAASKWTFINYIQTNMKKNNMYSKNDIILIIDGDDYLIPNNALKIINNKYNTNKCWCTFGESSGKFCEESRKKWLLFKKNKVFNNFRNVWMYNHPRSLKLHLILNFTKNDFLQENNEWLTKCTDRPIIYTMLELSGFDRISNIDKLLYYYRAHSNNSYKVVDSDLKKQQLLFVNSKPVKKVVQEKIHIVMCCWKREKFLKYQIENLNEQTVSNRIVLHLLNNNIDNIKFLSKLINKIKKKIKFEIRLTHYNNKYYGFQRFIYIKNYLLQKEIIDYVIIIDDDQIFDIDWVEKMYEKRKPKHYIAFYGRYWTKKNPSYWKDSIINIDDTKNNLKKNITEFHYGGTGGSIIDTNIFLPNSLLWHIPKDMPNNITIYNIEDLWLSFIVTYYYNWNIKRSYLPQKISLNAKYNKSFEVSLWKSLKDEKDILLDYLIKKGWKLN